MGARDVKDPEGSDDSCELCIVLGGLESLERSTGIFKAEEIHDLLRDFEVMRDVQDLWLPDSRNCAK
jgi:hypothetical protein